MKCPMCGSEDLKIEEKTKRRTVYLCGKCKVRIVVNNIIVWVNNEPVYVELDL